jgi:hypothetical protein
VLITKFLKFLTGLTDKFSIPEHKMLLCGRNTLLKYTKSTQNAQKKYWDARLGSRFQNAPVRRPKGFDFKGGKIRGMPCSVREDTTGKQSQNTRAKPIIGPVEGINMNKYNI